MDETKSSVDNECEESATSDTSMDMTSAASLKRSCPYKNDCKDAKRHTFDQDVQDTIETSTFFHVNASSSPNSVCPSIKTVVIPNDTVDRSKFCSQDESGTIHCIGKNPTSVESNKKITNKDKIIPTKAIVLDTREESDWKIAREFGTSSDNSSNKVTVINDEFSSVNDIQSKITKGTKINFIGIVVEMGKPIPQISKNGYPTSLTEVTLKDDNDSQIILAIQGPEVCKYPIQLNSVLLVKNATVIVYNDKKRLYCLRSCITIDENIPKTYRLKNLPPKHNTHDGPATAFPASSQICLRGSTSPTLTTAVETRSEISLDNSFFANCNFCSINEIKTKIAAQTVIDFIGLVVKVGSQESRTSRAGKDEIMREITLTDDNSAEIDLAIWTKKLKNKTITPNSVLLVKNTRVIVYNNRKTLSCRGSSVYIDPDIPETQRLRSLLSREIRNDTPVTGVALSTEAFVGETARETPVTGIGTSSEISLKGSSHTTPTTAVGVRSEIVWNNTIFTNCNFSSINEIETKIAEKAVIDFIGLVIKVGREELRTTRAGKDEVMKDVTLTDDNCSEIDLVIWSEKFSDAAIPPKSVLLVKNSKVIVYNGRKKLRCRDFCVCIDPDIPETSRLRSLPSREIASDTPVTGVGASTKTSLGVIARETPVTGIGTSSEISLKGSSRATPTMAVGARPKIVWNNTIFANCNFSSINEIETKIAEKAVIDFIGLVIKVGREELRTTRAGKDEVMKDVTLTDDNCSEIDLVIWSEKFGDAAILPKSVLLVKNSKVIVYNGRKKLRCRDFCVCIDPDIPESHRLRNLPSREIASDIPATGVGTSTENSLERNSRVTSSTAVETRPTILWSNTLFANCNFSSINEIETDIAENRVTDFLGFVVKIGNEKLRKTRAGKCETVTDVTLTDGNGSEIDVAIWSEHFGALSIAPNSVLLIKNGRVCVHNYKKKLSVRDFCICINPDMPKAHELKKRMEDIAEEAIKQPLNKFELELPFGKPKRLYTPLNVIPETVQQGSSIDVLGVVIRVYPLTNLLRDGKECCMMKVVLLDQSEKEMSMTILGSHAKSITKEHLIVEVLNVSISVYKEKKKLVCSEETSSLTVEPDVEEADEMREWFENVWLRNTSVDPPTMDLVAATYTPIRVIHENVKEYSIINILGIVHYLGSLSITETEDGGVFYRRHIEILDDTRKSITLIIFGGQAETIIHQHKAIAGINLRVCVMNDRKILECSDVQSAVIVDPPIERAWELEKWFDIHAATNPLVEIARPITPNNLVFENFKNGNITSVLGILAHKNELELVKRSNEILNLYRKIKLIDSSGVTINVLLWGDRAANFDVAKRSILVITDVRVCVRDQLKYCSCLGMSNIIVNPTDPEFQEDVKRLQLWSSNDAIRDPLDTTIGPIAVGNVLNSTMISKTPASQLRSCETPDKTHEKVDCLRTSTSRYFIECVSSETDYEGSSDESSYSFDGETNTFVCFKDW